MQPKMTPLMQQYWSIKDQYPREILLFRMGDFFEIFHQDAETAAPILNIALTQRNKKDAESPKMCGVPHHSIAGPIAKLLKAGHKVAMCDQIEDPALAKGIVKRAVTRVLTPGMVYDPDTLDQLSANYLAAYDDTQIAFADITTGEAFVYDYACAADREELLALLTPVELVLSPVQVRERGRVDIAHTLMCSEMPGDLASCERLSAYIEKLQGSSQIIRMFEKRGRRNGLRISSTALRHLEVFADSRNAREGSLFYAINRARTSAGSRLLRSWLSSPLSDRSELRKRQNEIELWLTDTRRLTKFREMLGQLGDVERRLGKLHSTTFSARDLEAIAQSIMVGQSLNALHPQPILENDLEPAVALARMVLDALAEDLPLGLKEGGLIRRGYSSALDELILLTQNTQQLLRDLETREKAATNLSTLKVRYNNVFGFYIEITKAQAGRAPTHYRRKQTLTNAERYTTDELDQLEEKILSGRSKRDQLEFEIFSGLRLQVESQLHELLRLGRIWTKWDTLSSLSWLALERRYVRPEFVEEGLDLELSRHPVVEVGGNFTPNSVRLLPGEGLLLTGPNMAGKSTLMRQVALIAIMAQIGSYVPAERARLPLFDEIFTRIGASDALSEGLSTFMVEMSETSAILKKVTPRSLVVMDEIGRGTSTYDGLSLAQAILEHLLSHKQPYLMFATHYHELTKLNVVFPQLRNAHMSVLEKNGEIRFLHTLQPGPANRSYGIHVARLAGLPNAITNRAQGLLTEFEGTKGHQLTLGDFSTTTSGPSVPALVAQVKELNLSHMTPLEALNKLFEWQREVSS